MKFVYWYITHGNRYIGIPSRLIIVVYCYSDISILVYLLIFKVYCYFEIWYIGISDPLVQSPFKHDIFNYFCSYSVRWDAQVIDNKFLLNNCTKSWSCAFSMMFRIHACLICPNSLNQDIFWKSLFMTWYTSKHKSALQQIPLTYNVFMWAGICINFT